MKRDLDAARAPKVDQNLYYGMYYRFLDYSLLFIRALSRICRGFTLYLPFFHHVSKLLKMWTFHFTIRPDTLCHDVDHLNCFSLIV